MNSTALTVHHKRLLNGLSPCYKSEACPTCAATVYRRPRQSLRYGTPVAMFIDLSRVDDYQVA